MKRRNWMALLAALVMAAALLAGCGATAAADSMEYWSYDAQASNKGTPMEEIAVEEPESADLSITADSTTYSTNYAEQKLIKTVEIDTETEDLEAMMAQLTRQIAGVNGYMEAQEIYNGSSYSSSRYRSARLTIRVPAESLGDFVGEVEGISNVVTYNETVEDVTLTYVDTESRIAALETERDRLLELLAQAETMYDLLEIEARMSEVQYALESANSRLRVLANQVNYATVYLNIDQVTVYTDVEEPTVWQRITKGFGRNLENIGDDLVDFFVWVVTYSPQLILWAVIIAVAVMVVRRTVRKRKAAKAPKIDQPEQE